MLSDLLHLLYHLFFLFVSGLINRVQRRLYSSSGKRDDYEVSEWTIWKRQRSEYEPVREEHFISSYSRRSQLNTLLEPNHVVAQVKAEENRVVLLKAEGDVYNTEKYPFFYHATYLDAHQKKVARFDTFIHMMDRQPWPEMNVIFLWSVGRCGSTLLANLFTSFQGFATISEPDDIFSLYSLKDRMSEADFERANSNLLKYHMIQIQKRDPETECVIIKPRSMAFWWITQSPKAIEERTTHIFMYRDVQPTFKSFVKSFGMDGLRCDSIIAKLLDLDAMVEACIPPIEKTLTDNFSECEEQVLVSSNIRRSSPVMLVQMCFGGLPYLLLLYKMMVKSGRLDENYLFAVKYENLVADPVGQFEKIAKRVKSFTFEITDSECEKLLKLSKIDSQANSALSQKNLNTAKTENSIPESMSTPFEEIMVSCGLEKDREPGFILPRTLI